MSGRSCGSQILYVVGLTCSYFFTLLAHVVLISLYPVFIIGDIVLILFTLNFICTKDQYAFMLTYMLMDFHSRKFCGTATNHKNIFSSASTRRGSKSTLPIMLDRAGRDLPAGKTDYEGKALIQRFRYYQFRNNKLFLINTSIFVNLYEINMFHLAFSFPDTQSVFMIKQAIQCQFDCSNSSILSIAAHIVENFMQLIPPNLCQNSTNSQSYRDASPENSYHPYFQLWTDYILDCYVNGHAVHFDSITYVEVSLPTELKESLQLNLPNLYVNKKMLLPAHLSVQARISSIFDIPLINKQRTIAVFNNNAPYSQDDPFSPRINDPAIFIGNLFNNDSWLIFNIAKGNIPSVEDIMTFNGVVLTGSEYSVLDVYPHMQNMIEKLIQAYRKKEDFRILGVCYGHQLISKHFNAVVMKKEKTKRLELIEFDTDILKKHSFFSPIRKKSCLLSQFHQDYVETIPEGFNLVGKSKSCNVEMLLSHDNRILTAQFHTQYSCKFTQAFVSRSSYYLQKFDESFFYSRDSQEIENRHLEDCSSLIKVFAMFLAG